jgi:PKD repeat protein
MKIKLLLSILVLTSISSGAFSTIRTVPSSYATIQQAINSSANGDTVLVALGVYYENLNLNGKNIMLCSNFVITGDTSYISNTIIDGSHAGRVITIEQGENENCRIVGFTLQHGHAQGSNHVAGDGGGILTAYSSPIISHCIIRNNIANHTGGGINIHGYEHSGGATNQTKVYNCTILNNTAGLAGGGIRGTNSDCEIINCIISGNSTTGGGGGGVHFYHKGKLINCLIVNNTATESAGGIYIDWGTFFGSQGVFIIGSTIANNIGANYGGTNYVINGGEFINCILWGNTNQSGNISNYSGSSFIYCCSYPLPAGAGNISNDPMFVNALEGNFRPGFNSPCIDSGNNIHNTTLHDLDGNPRIANEIIDMGCYEHQSGVINDFFASAVNICINDTVIFNPILPVIAPDSVLWHFQGGNPETSNEFQPLVEYSELGFYDVTLTSYWQGSSLMISKVSYIGVHPFPEIPAKPEGEQLICFNQQSASYTTNTNTVIWEIAPPQSGSISYSDSTCIIYWNEAFHGEAQLSVQSFNNCGTSELSESLTIIRTARPDIDFAATPLFIPEAPYEVQFTNLTPNPELYNFTWHFGNGDTSEENEPFYTYAESGLYAVSLVAEHTETGCSDTLTKADFIQCSAAGVTDNQKDGFRYFVNQTDKTLHLFFDVQPNGYHFILFGIDGKDYQTAVISEKVSYVSLYGLPTGVYLFRINTNDQIRNGKILIQN